MVGYVPITENETLPTYEFFGIKALLQEARYVLNYLKL